MKWFTAFSCPRHFVYKHSLMLESAFPSIPDWPFAQQRDRTHTCALCSRHRGELLTSFQKSLTGIFPWDGGSGARESLSQTPAGLDTSLSPFKWMCRWNSVPVTHWPAPVSGSRGTCTGTGIHKALEKAEVWSVMLHSGTTKTATTFCMSAAGLSQKPCWISLIPIKSSG